MSGRGMRVVLTVVVDIFTIIAVALAIRMFVVFSAQIASQNWALAYDAATKHVVIPFGFKSIKTPYRGVFDVNCAVTILVALLAEWGLTVARDRA